MPSPIIFKSNFYQVHLSFQSILLTMRYFKLILMHLNAFSTLMTFPNCSIPHLQYLIYTSQNTSINGQLLKPLKPLYCLLVLQIPCKLFNFTSKTKSTRPANKSNATNYRCKQRIDYCKFPPFLHITYTNCSYYQLSVN